MPSPVFTSVPLDTIVAREKKARRRASAGAPCPCSASRHYGGPGWGATRPRAGTAARGPARLSRKRHGAHLNGRAFSRKVGGRRLTANHGVQTTGYGLPHIHLAQEARALLGQGRVDEHARAELEPGHARDA